MTTRQQFDSDWDREEYSASIGYAVTDNFALYAGYRFSDTEFEDEGEITQTTLTPEPQSNPFNVSRQNDVELDGPFVGGTYSYQIGDTGSIGLNLAITTVEGEFGQTTRVSGFPEPIVQTSTGDAVATSIGMSWTAPLRILQNFNYVIGVDGYQYNFEGDEPAPGFSETLVRATAGVSYLF